MPSPVTLYRGDDIQKNVYPVEVSSWLTDGWFRTKEEAQQASIAKKTKAKAPTKGLIVEPTPPE